MSSKKKDLCMHLHRLYLLQFYIHIYIYTYIQIPIWIIQQKVEILIFIPYTDQEYALLSARSFDIRLD